MELPCPMSVAFVTPPLLRFPSFSGRFQTKTERERAREERAKERHGRNDERGERHHSSRMLRKFSAEADQKCCRSPTTNNSYKLKGEYYDMEGNRAKSSTKIHHEFPIQMRNIQRILHFFQGRNQWQLCCHPSLLIDQNVRKKGLIAFSKTDRPSIHSCAAHPQNIGEQQTRAR